MKRLLFIVLGWLMLGVAVHAASFDCGKAATTVEKLICADVELSKLDEELTSNYKTALQDEKQGKAIRQTQKQWLMERNGCSDAACVKRAYETRLHELSSPTAAHPLSDHGEATKQKAAPQIGKPLYGHCVDVGPAGGCGRGRSGKGYAVCEAYLKHLNSLMETPKCEVPVPPGFKQPDWEEMDVMKHLNWAHQIELAQGVPSTDKNFESWSRTFIEQTKSGRIAPQMRKTRVQPFGEKMITLLAYTGDSLGCKRPEDSAFPRYHWFQVGYAYFLLTDDPKAQLRVIEGGLDSVSKGQAELLLYASKPYFARRFFGSTAMSIIAFNLKMTNTSEIAASIDAFYAKVAPGTVVVVDTMKQFEPDPNVYWADQLCDFLPVNP